MEGGSMDIYWYIVWVNVLLCARVSLHLAVHSAIELERDGWGWHHLIPLSASGSPTSGSLTGSPTLSIGRRPRIRAGNPQERVERIPIKGRKNRVKKNLWWRRRKWLEILRGKSSTFGWIRRESPGGHPAKHLRENPAATLSILAPL